MVGAEATPQRETRAATAAGYHAEKEDWNAKIAAPRGLGDRLQ
jgi:hypothetical protein